MLSTNPKIGSQLDAASAAAVQTILQDTFKLYFLILAVLGAAALLCLVAGYEKSWRRTYVREEPKKEGGEAGKEMARVVSTGGQTGFREVQVQELNGTTPVHGTTQSVQDGRETLQVR
jgi:hypothetical protein